MKNLINKKLTDKDEIRSAWVLCPFCQAKTKTKILDDSILLRFPLYCPRCKKEMKVDVIQGIIYFCSQ
ncbi:cysteine-rich KTR domain-containing protein [Gemmiger gallinarum]|uniref:cysteine-rich KTR domain-containing protein n=1 Tax=Gemmiger gallinarum TaxID=2779354 RepID=UPI002E2B986E|nr:cysteine-rich KTR domain-containing protein [Gemmiger gallinarum]